MPLASSNLNMEIRISCKTRAVFAFISLLLSDAISVALRGLAMNTKQDPSLGGKAMTRTLVRATARTEQI